MKGNLRTGHGRRKGSTSSKGSIWPSIALGSHKNIMPKQRLQRGVFLDVQAEGQAPKVFIGPSVGGKQMKLVEVVSGSVEDKKPFYV